MKLKARVRGVYSTAMTRMLLDNRFEIVQPSLAIKERFKFDENVGLPDLDIYDQRNRQGVHVVGTAESIGALRTILLDSLMDVICKSIGKRNLSLIGDVEINPQESKRREGSCLALGKQILHERGISSSFQAEAG